MRKIEKITKDKTIYICDFCKDEYSGGSCSGCSKDMCRDCIKSWDYRYSEDYPDKYCETCTNIRNKYSERISKLNREINEIEEKCEKECSSNTGSGNKGGKDGLD